MTAAAIRRTMSTADSALVIGSVSNNAFMKRSLKVPTAWLKLTLRLYLSSLSLSPSSMTAWASYCPTVIILLSKIVV
jgi:hypothetical protein